MQSQATAQSIIPLITTTTPSTSIPMPPVTTTNNGNAVSASTTSTTSNTSDSEKKSKGSTWKNILFWVGLVLLIMLIIGLVIFFLTRCRRKRPELDMDDLTL